MYHTASLQCLLSTLALSIIKFCASLQYKQQKRIKEPTVYVSMIKCISGTLCFETLPQLLPLHS